MRGHSEPINPATQSGVWRVPGRDSQATIVLGRVRAAVGC